MNLNRFHKKGKTMKKYYIKQPLRGFYGIKLEMAESDDGDYYKVSEVDALIKELESKIFAKECRLVCYSNYCDIPTHVTRDQVFCRECRYHIGNCKFGGKVGKEYDKCCAVPVVPDPVTGNINFQLCRGINKDCNCPMFERKKP